MQPRSNTYVYYLVFLRLAESIDTATIETLSKIHVEGREFST